MIVELLPELDGALVVTIPSQVSHLVVGRSVELARAHGVRLLGVVENMAGYLCPHCGAMGDLFAGDSRAHAEALGLQLLGQIPFDPRVAQCADRGSPYVVEYKETPTGEALRTLAARISSLISLGGTGQ